MRSLCKAFLVVGALALVVQLAPAQQPRRGGGGGGGLGTLLQNKDVQKELSLTDEQIEKAKKVTDEVGEKHKDEFAKIQDLAREDRGPKMMELGAQVKEETLKGLADVLKPEQTKRLKQLALQQQVVSPFGGGPGVFLTPEVEKALTLNDKQKDDLKTMSEDFRKEMREAFQAAGQGGFNEETQKKFAEMRKDAMDKALKVLDEKQTKEWQEMTGPAFEFKFQPRGRRPGGNPPPR